MSVLVDTTWPCRLCPNGLRLCFPCCACSTTCRGNADPRRFLSQLLVSRKLWASPVPMGKHGPSGHSSSCLPAEISALPLGQDLTFSLDDGLNVNIAVSLKLPEDLSQRCQVLGIPTRSVTQVLLSKTLVFLGQRGQQHTRASFTCLRFPWVWPLVMDS